MNRKRISRPPKRNDPSPDQPGTLIQQMQIVLLFGQNPWSIDDRDLRWQAARRTVLQHARRRPSK